MYQHDVDVPCAGYAAASHRTSPAWKDWRHPSHPTGRGSTLDGYRSALDDLHALLRQIRHAARWRRWREALRTLADADEALDRVRYELLRAARAEGLSWPEVGRLVGLSAQAVQQRYRRLRHRYGGPDQQ